MSDETQAEEAPRIEFDCKRCGEPWTVGFQPRDINDMLCRDCFDETGGRTYDLSNLAKAPRRKHGTRVAFRITCSECGKDDELDYVPKGVPIAEILCKDCMLTAKGHDSRWAIVEKEKDREQGKRKRYEFTCDGCGGLDTVPFETQPGRTYFCYKCYLKVQEGEEVGPVPEPPGPKHDLGDHVFIRRKK